MGEYYPSSEEWPQYVECLEFLNQAHAGLWPVCAWFLRIVSVRTSVCVCVCVSVPKAINN